MHQHIAEANHVDPVFAFFDVDVTRFVQQTWNIAVPVDRAQPRIRDDVVSQVSKSLNGELQEGFRTGERILVHSLIPTKSNTQRMA